MGLEKLKGNNIKPVEFRKTENWMQHQFVRFVWMLILQWFLYLVDIYSVVRGMQSNYRNVCGVVVQY